MDRTSLQRLETLLKEFKSTAKQNTADPALGYEIEELLDKYRDDLKEVWQSTNYHPGRSDGHFSNHQLYTHSFPPSSNVTQY
jgi:hypothetical protein